VLRHVKQFTSHVKFVSIVGTEEWVTPTLSEHLSADEDLVVREPSFTSIIKQRFVEPITDGKELSKLFSVNYIDDGPLADVAASLVAKRLAKEIKKADAVLLLDFGHGLMQGQIRELVQSESKFLALNCQTNSNNHGFNIITRQYRKAHSVTLDEQELMLSAGH